MPLSRRLLPEDVAGSIRLTAWVADDDDMTRGLLCAVLINAGLNVLGESADGAQAFEAIDRLKPEVIFLDIDMPSFSGLEILTKIRQHDDHTIALLITASPTAQLARDAVRLRADGVIGKPFNAQRICREISRAVAARASRQEMLKNR